MKDWELCDLIHAGEARLSITSHCINNSTAEFCLRADIVGGGMNVIKLGYEAQSFLNYFMESYC